MWYSSTVIDRLPLQAKRLLLTHFSARYLVAKSYCLGNQRRQIKTRLEELPIEETQVMDLVDEAAKVFDRERILAASDLMAVSVPLGGFEPVSWEDGEASDKQEQLPGDGSVHHPLRASARSIPLQRVQHESPRSKRTRQSSMSARKARVPVAAAL